jgi:hypothetical protein
VASYEFRDANAARLTRKPVYYRLRQVDVNGKDNYGPTRVVQFAAAARLDVSVYPNPASSRTSATLDLTGVAAGAYEVQITDVHGRSLRHLTLAGAQEHPLNVQGLVPGLYLVRLQGAAGSVTLPFVCN